MKLKTYLALILCLAVSATTLAGCGKQPGNTSNGGGGGTQGGSTKDTVVIVTSGDPGRLRSDTLNSLKEIPFNRLAYDYLFTRNSKGEFEPCICQSYELDSDNLGVTLHLRQGVKFHDGNTMTADDVLASLYYGKQDTASGSQLDFIDFDNSKPLDDNTLYLKFNRTNGVWQSSFLAIGIIERSAYEAAASPDEFYLNPMTTSAYVLENWVSGDSLTFKAFPDHWYGAPKIENIIVRVISESSVALMELQTGGADVLFNLSLANYESACKMENVTGYDKQPPIINVFLGCNLENEALSNPDVRKAIACAIDWDAICAGAFDGAAVPCVSPLGRNALGFDTKWETEYPYPYSPEKAKEYLAAAGYADGLALRVLVDETPSRQLMAEQLSNMFAAVGITLTIDKYDAATTDDIVANSSDYDLYIRGAYNNSGDIVTFLRTSMGFTAINADADKELGPVYADYLNRISAEMDQTARAGLYKEFQEAFLNDMMYWMPGVQMTIYAAYNSAIDGIEWPGEYWIWNNAYFK
ncbi:MAG: ABC transporter substrate-binding protein [Lawsonibacter sp.]|nr:ABC transporter substrate-binding protein [Lawsonibacter sp.]